jgi:ATPase subunit of ABC transporter with duplicated ATPase domains
MPSVSLEVKDLSFSFSDAPLLEGVSFSLVPGWTGLVGPNGAGKSTLLGLLDGTLRPTGGQVRLRPVGARVVHCAPRPEELPPLVRDFLEAPDREAARWRAVLELPHDALERFASLSPGERQRAHLGGALWTGPDVLLLDEPTNHLDEAARALVLAACRRFGGLGLVVSHDRALLDALTERTLRLERGAVEVHALPYSQAQAAWRAAEDADAQAYEQQRSRLERNVRHAHEAKREHASAARNTRAGNRMKHVNDRDATTLGADYRAAQAEASHAQALRRANVKVERARAALDSLEVVRRRVPDFRFDFEPCPRPLAVSLRLERLAPEGGPILASEVALDVARDEHVALEGPNGAGKSTLLAALARACTLPEERVLTLPQELCAEDAEGDLELVRELPPAERGRVLQLVDALGVDPDRLLASRAPSSGEARKLRLALGLGRAAWLLLLDEPTNDLDLPSVERLEAVLAAWPGALVLVSHDPQLVERVCSRRVRLEGGAVREAR